MPGRFIARHRTCINLSFCSHNLEFQTSSEWGNNWEQRYGATDYACCPCYTTRRNKSFVMGDTDVTVLAMSHIMYKIGE